MVKPISAENLYAEKILDLVKSKQGIKFDKELSDLLQINQSDIGNWRRRGTIPRAMLNKLKSDYLDDVDIEALLGSDNVNIVNRRLQEKDHVYIIELQKEEITFLKEKIVTLEKQVSKLIGLLK